MRKYLAIVVAAIIGASAWAGDVISLNFHSDQGAASDGNGIVPANGWVDLTGNNGTSTTVTSQNGAAVTSVAWSSKECWSATAGVNYIKGYLDDGNEQDGNRISITVTGIPFERYDVIVYQNTDDSSATGKYNPPKVNNTIYTFSNGKMVVASNQELDSGDNDYGFAAVRANAILGVNALYIDGNNLDGMGFTGDLTISGGSFRSHTLNCGRGCIAAIQIVEHETATVVDVSTDTSVSAINITAGDASVVTLKIGAAATLTMDTTFTASKVKVVGSDTLTLSASDQPSAAELAKFDFSRFSGALPRSWLKKTSFGYNLHSSAGSDTSGALEQSTWDSNANAPSSEANILLDGLTKVTWRANTIYQDGGSNNTFVRGYLDDGNGGNYVSIDNIPAATYDVIIYSTTDNSTQNNLSYKRVNGTNYSVDSNGTLKTDSTDSWGQGHQSDNIALGVNAMRINNLSGRLEILSTRNGTVRGCISAVQVILAGTSESYTVGASETVAVSIINSWAENNDIVSVTFEDGASINADVALNTGATFMSYTVQGALNVSGVAVGGFAPSADSVTAVDGAAIIYTDVTSAGNIPYAMTQTPVKVVLKDVAINAEEGEVSLGSNSNASSINQDFEVTGTSSITVPTLKLGNGKGTQTLTQTSGSISVTGTINNTTDSSSLFAHWPNNVTYDLIGGSLATAAAIRFGWNGTIEMTVGGGETFALVTTPGFAAGHTPGASEWRSNKAVLTIAPNGEVRVGEFGLPFSRSNNAELILAGGKLTLTEDTEISSVKDISVTADSTIEVAAGKSVVISGKTSGEGHALLSLGQGASVMVVSGCETALATSAGAAIKVQLTDVEVSLGYTTAGAFAEGTSVTFVNAAGYTLSTVMTTAESPNAVFIPSGLNWDGNSGTWSDSQFDGEARSSDSSTAVAFIDAATPYESVTVTVSGNDKTVATLGFFAETTKYTLTGTPRIGTVGSVVVQGIEAAIYTPLTVGSDLIIEEGATLTIGNADTVIGDGKLKGAGALILDIGEGNTFTMSSSNTDYTGEVTIKSGTVLMGDAKSFGEMNRASSIRVKGGATLDTNGKIDERSSLHKNKVILEENATITSSGNYGDWKLAAVSSLTLEGDAIVDTKEGKNFSVAVHFNAAKCPIDLGEHTLTKTGPADFVVSCCNITGTGTLDVREGGLVFYHGSGDAVCADGTIRIANGCTLKLGDYSENTGKPSIKNLILDGEVVDGNYGGALTITGILTGSGSTPLLTLAEGAAIRPRYDGVITLTGVPTTTLKFDMSNFTPATSSIQIVLVKFGSLEVFQDITEENIIGGIPRGWRLVKTADGLGWRLKKSAFIIRFR